MKRFRVLFRTVANPSGSSPDGARGIAISSPTPDGPTDDLQGGFRDGKKGQRTSRGKDRPAGKQADRERCELVFRMFVRYRINY